MVGKIKVPLSNEALKRLAHVIGEMELKTEGEIRLMIVQGSLATGHVRQTLFGLLLSIAFFVFWLERHYLIWTAASWLVPAVVAATFTLAWVLSRVPWVIRALTPLADLRRQVWHRAELEFYREGLHQTAQQTGILLFVSLLERQALVLADKGISSRLGEEYWRSVVETLLKGPRSGDWEASFAEAIRDCGKTLAEHFPAQARNRNELSNTVILKA